MGGYYPPHGTGTVRFWAAEAIRKAAVRIDTYLHQFWVRSKSGQGTKSRGLDGDGPTGGQGFEDTCTYVDTDVGTEYSIRCLPLELLRKYSVHTSLVRNLQSVVEKGGSRG